MAEQEGVGIAREMTAAILFGASTFPLHTFTSHPVFLNAKQALRRYLSDSGVGLGLPDGDILDLFDSPDSAPQLAAKMSVFLKLFNAKADGIPPRNLIVYYVGHGFFLRGTNDFCFALACTDSTLERMTALRCADLAEILKAHTSTFRKFIVVDCCYSGTAAQHFQGTPATVIAMNLRRAFKGRTKAPEPPHTPKRGTAVFCASSKDIEARIPEGGTSPMFSDALIRVLTDEHPAYGRYLSLSDVNDIVWKRLQYVYERPVRPELHAVDQSDGNVAERVLLFRNAAVLPNLPGKQSESARNVRRRQAIGGRLKSPRIATLVTDPTPPLPYGNQWQLETGRSLSRSSRFFTQDEACRQLHVSITELSKFEAENRLFSVSPAVSGRPLSDNRLYPAFLFDPSNNIDLLQKIIAILSSKSG